MSIEFQCPGCGKSYSLGAELAGKKGRCKQCGEVFRVPGKAAAPAASASASVPAPPAVDLYGLAEMPAPAKKGSGGDGIFADEAVKPRAAASGDDGPLPPRAGYEPMTDAKRKKIAKRAAKVDKTKTSYAGSAYGVSFGTVLAIALFGWRMYRKVDRAIDRFSPDRPAATAPASEADIQRSIIGQMDRAVSETAARPDAAEAREWLDPSHPDHVVMEMPTEKAREMVEGFYERGAEWVRVLEPEKIGKSMVTATFAVKLPADAEQRKKCLEWHANYLEGEDRHPDLGQTYLSIGTD